MKKTRSRKGNAFFIWELLKAALFGSLLTVALMLLFSLMLYWGWLPDGAIPVANVLFKGLSAALAGWWMGRSETALWWHGGVAAIGYLAFSTLLMAIFLGTFSLRWNLLADALLLFVLGCALTALTHHLHQKHLAKQ